MCQLNSHPGCYISLHFKSFNYKGETLLKRQVEGVEKQIKVVTTTVDVQVKLLVSILRKRFVFSELSGLRRSLVGADL